MTQTTLTMTRHLPAAPEAVFAAWTDPSLTGRWLFTSPQGKPDARIDLRVGGKWRIADIRTDSVHVATGEYVEVERPRRLVFTFALPQFSPNTDTITVDLAPDGEGCVMAFSQSGSDIARELIQTPAGEASGSQRGWAQMFDTLEIVLRG